VHHFLLEFSQIQNRHRMILATDFRY
jgi:hypothetical protein